MPTKLGQIWDRPHGKTERAGFALPTLRVGGPRSLIGRSGMFVAGEGQAQNSGPETLRDPRERGGDSRSDPTLLCAPCSRQSNSLAGGEAPYVNVMRRDRRRGDAYMNHWIETRSVLDAVSSLSDHCLTQGAATPHGRCPWGASVFSFQRLSSAVQMDAGLDMGALHRQLNFPFSSEHGAPNVGRSHIGAATLSQTHQ
jgi:hypothetical protein